MSSSGRFPFPPAPTGWFQVAHLGDLQPRPVRPLRCFGQDLVAWRSASGAVQVAEAFCPHLGAHLGYGGTVDGEAIVCPFHGWSFDSAGANLAVPYSDRSNAQARLAMLPTAVANGVVFAWHGPEGSVPTWEVPVLPESEDDCFVEIDGPRVRIRSHVQELVENAVDVAHFQFVHRTAGFGAVELVHDGPMLRSEAAVTFVTPRGDVEGSVVSELWGLGIDVVRPKGILDAAVIFGVTPLEEGVVEAGYTFFVPRSSHGEGPSNVGRAMMADFDKQLAQDTPIWEHKAYQTSPALAKGDGPILEFRRWAAQFYA